MTRPFKGSIRKIDFSCSGKCNPFSNHFIFKISLDAICSSSDGRLCLVKSSTGKVKLRIDDIFSSKASIGCFVSLDEEDKFLAAGNDDGDIKVPEILLF